MMTNKLVSCMFQFLSNLFRAAACIYHAFMLPPLVSLSLRHGIEVGRVLAKGMNNMLQWHIEVRNCSYVYKWYCCYSYQYILAGTVVN